MNTYCLDIESLVKRLKPDDSEQSARKRIFGLGERELAMIREFGQKLSGKEAEIVDALHDHLSSFPEPATMLANATVAERLKHHQQKYFSDLLSGNLDDDYFLSRVRAGVTHHEQKLRLRWFFGSFAFFLDRLLPEIRHIAGDDVQKMTEYTRLLIRLALFDMAQTVSFFVHADREQLRLLSTVFETNLEAVAIADLNGIIQHVNRSLVVIAGYEPREIVGASLQILHATRDQKLAATIWDKVREGGQWQGEIWLRRKNGEEFPAWMSATAAKDKDVMTHVIVEFSDITDFKQTQDALARRTEELENSNRELEQFAYVASHDLQEPLRMVASYTQLLARRYKDKLDDDANEFIHYAVDGATRMQALINDLLTLSRVSTRGKPLEMCDAGLALSRALSNLKIAIEESGAKITHDAMPSVKADISQLTQLFQNLIGNALKFRGEAPPKVHVGVVRKAREWEFSVRDNGIGIAPEFFERIFVIFQRLHGKHEYPGTGIGLAVCKKIVERHGGHIWVESKPGEGATFYFTLPTNGEEENQ
ncbi:MAG: ATP-binding protein [Methylophilaceae bacterium]|nr:ATP-binding protein [Methylophilaceae bacterium]